MDDKKPPAYKTPYSKNQTESSSPGSGPVSKWFKEDLSRRSASKRIGKGVAWAAGLGLVGLTGYKLFSSDEPDIERDSLELQQKEGWNVGSTDKPLTFDPTFTQATASVKDSDWKQYVEPNKLIAAYQPTNAKWQPYFVPTLIQSLAQQTLRDQIKPVKTALMDEAYGQAEALKELLSQSANANEALIVSELDGIQSVAFGAAMADFAQIVPVFDNWPHPLGVVRSHETLGALVYYAKEIEDKKAKLKDNAPTVLLLDSQRLNEYKDEETQFDNRYLAKLPSAADLKQRGITSLMYVVKDDRRKEEMDDLNDEFVEYGKQNINIRFLKLSDFKTPAATTVAGTNPLPANNGQTTYVNRYYYGGSPFYHWYFYDHYYYRPYPYAYTSYGGSRMAYSRPTAPAPFQPSAYRPVSRPTMFSGSRVGGASGVGRNRPSGFGRTSVRMSGGQVTGVRSGRSGSYGRSGGGWFGG